MASIGSINITLDTEEIKDIVRSTIIEELTKAKELEDVGNLFEAQMFNQGPDIPFIVHDGQVYINKGYVDSTKCTYPVMEMADNGEWVIYKDGSMSIMEPDFTYSGFIKY